jgi:hypothetical protein
MVAAFSCGSACPYGLATTTTDGDIYTIAGDGTGGITPDGRPAADSELSTPWGLAPIFA